MGGRWGVDGKGGVVDHLVGSRPGLGVGVGEVVDVVRGERRLEGRLLKTPTLFPVGSCCLVDDRPL